MDFLKKATESFEGGDGKQGDGKQGDVVKEAEGFLSGGGEKKAEESTTTKAPEEAAASDAAAVAKQGGGGYSEVMGSAQTLYKGIQDKMSGKDVDESKLAGAADEVLKAADRSGFAKDSPYSTYLTKAEDYLHKQAGKGSSTTAAPTATEDVPAAPESK